MLYSIFFFSFNQVLWLISLINYFLYGDKSNDRIIFIIYRYFYDFLLVSSLAVYLFYGRICFLLLHLFIIQTVPMITWFSNAKFNLSNLFSLYILNQVSYLMIYIFLTENIYDYIPHAITLTSFNKFHSCTVYVLEDRFYGIFLPIYHILTLLIRYNKVLQIEPVKEKED